MGGHQPDQGGRIRVRDRRSVHGRDGDLRHRMGLRLEHLDAGRRILRRPGHREPQLDRELLGRHLRHLRRQRHGLQGQPQPRVRDRRRVPGHQPADLPPVRWRSPRRRPAPSGTTSATPTQTARTSTASPPPRSSTGGPTSTSARSPVRTRARGRLAATRNTSSRAASSARQRRGTAGPGPVRHPIDRAEQAGPDGHRQPVHAQPRLVDAGHGAGGVPDELGPRRQDAALPGDPQR